MKIQNLFLILSVVVMTGCATAQPLDKNPNEMTIEELRYDNERLRLLNQNRNLRNVGTVTSQSRTRNYQQQWPAGATGKATPISTYYNKQGKPCTRYVFQHTLNGRVETSVGHKCHSLWDDGDAWRTR